MNPSNQKALEEALPILIELCESKAGPNIRADSLLDSVQSKIVKQKTFFEGREGETPEARVKRLRNYLRPIVQAGVSRKLKRKSRSPVDRPLSLDEIGFDGVQNEPLSIEEAELLDRFLDELQDEQLKTIAFLRFGGDATRTEIAKQLELSQDAVGRRIRKIDTTMRHFAQANDDE
jgi:RNA polymerase sigma factor (sigma-70 family)